MMGIKISIREIANGVLVEYFSDDGKREFDKECVYASLPDALDGISKWIKELE